MKVEDKQFEVTSTLQGEEVEMGIDKDSFRHIMGVLTKLYSRPGYAVVREYSTNALDAHVEAGITDPIEVTLPTALSPFLSVRDHGVGLDAEDIRKMYSQYGASSKRESNDQVGQLGLGSKSALAYTNQFTLVGVKNGVRVQVSVSMNHEGGGTMTILDESPTDEPNGVEIIVPSKDRWAMQEDARNFFRFWKPGTVLVDGEEPQRIEGLSIADDLLLVSDTVIDQSYVVMGNVPYPWPGRDQVGDRHVVAFVNIGDVAFTPSRESLMLTHRTKETLAELSRRVEEERDEALNKILQAAPNTIEAMKIATKIHGLFAQKTEMRYGNLPIPLRFELKGKDEHFIILAEKKYYRGKAWQRVKSLLALELIETVWVYGFEGDKLSPYKEKKLRQWASKKGLRPTRFILTPRRPDRRWVEKGTIFSWATGPQLEKIVTERTHTGRIAGSYDVWTYDPTAVEEYRRYVEERGVPSEKFDTSKPLFYSLELGSVARTLIFDKHPDATIVVLTSNRVSKFTRIFPEAEQVETYLGKTIRKWAKSLSYKNRLVLRLAKNEPGDTLRMLDETRVSDPAVQDAIRLAKLSQRPRFKAMLAKLRQGEGLLNDRLLAPTKWTNPLQKYGLLEHLNTWRFRDMRDDVYLYLNAVYATTINPSTTTPKEV